MKKEKLQRHMQYRRGNLLIAGVMLVLFVSILIMSLSLGGNTSRVSKIVSLIGIILCVLEILVQWSGYKNPNADDDEILPKPQLIKWYYFFLLLVLLYVSMNVMGFVISSFLFLALCPYILGYRNLKVVLIYSVVITALLYFSFVKIFFIRLPLGILF